MNDQTLRQSIQDIARKHPQTVKLHRIGFSSTEYLPIFALETGSGDRRVLMIGQHHGDEVLGVEIVMAWLRLLTDDATRDPQVTRLLQEYTFWIIPTINPEGYRVVTNGLYANKRKTNRDTDNNGRMDYATDGVDLNRNFPTFWENDPRTPTTSPYFKGSAAGSEAETQSILTLAQRITFEIGLFYHSSVTGVHSEKIFLPWHNPRITWQEALYQETLAIAETYASRLKKEYSDGFYEVHTGVLSRVGNARNHFFHTHRTKAFLVEVGGVNPQGISVIHPSGRKMRRIVRKHLDALKALFLDLSNQGR